MRSRLTLEEFGTLENGQFVQLRIQADTQAVVPAIVEGSPWSSKGPGHPPDSIRLKYGSRKKIFEDFLYDKISLYQA